MKFTADQLFEISQAIRGGLRDDDLARSTKAERAKYDKLARARVREQLADPTLTESVRQSILLGAEFIGKPEECARRARERFYNIPATERSRRAAGLKMAVNDDLSHVKYYTETQRAAINRRLAAAKLPSLRTLQIGFKRKHVQILKRGTIRNEEEYYIVREILSDVSFDIPARDRLSLEKLAVKFEQGKG